MFTVLLSLFSTLISPVLQFFFMDHGNNVLEKRYYRHRLKYMISKQWWEQRQKMEHFLVDKENHSLKVTSWAQVDSFAESREDTLG